MDKIGGFDPSVASSNLAGDTKKKYLGMAELVRH